MVRSPMPGTIVKLFSGVGEAVRRGSAILSIESMKMEYLVKAERDATVKSVNVKEKDFVGLGDVLVEFEEEQEQKSTKE